MSQDKNEYDQRSRLPLSDVANKYQRTLAFWNGACQDRGFCDICPFGESKDDICFVLWDYLDNYLNLHSAKKKIEQRSEIEKIQAEVGRKLPHPIMRKKEVWIQCLKCGLQQTLYMLNGVVTDSKFIQFEDGTINHRHPDGNSYYCEVKG
jgi:hypothetical protein